MQNSHSLLNDSLDSKNISIAAKSCYNNKNIAFWPLLNMIYYLFCNSTVRHGSLMWPSPLSCFWSQEAHVTDADTKKSPNHLNAKTPTPVPRMKVCAELFSGRLACARLCLCNNAPQCTCCGSFCLGLSAGKCSVVVYAWRSRVKLARTLQIPLHSSF